MSSHTTSPLGVMMELTFLSPREKTRSIISCSSSSITPAVVPWFNQNSDLFLCNARLDIRSHPQCTQHQFRRALSKVNQRINNLEKVRKGEADRAAMRSDWRGNSLWDKLPIIKVEEGYKRTTHCQGKAGAVGNKGRTSFK